MSINVNVFDTKEAEAELKKCPKIVRDYVRLLKDNADRWEELTKTAIKKLKEKDPG